MRVAPLTHGPFVGVALLALLLLPRLVLAAPAVKLAPETQPRSGLKKDMRRILSGRDYRQLVRETLRAQKKHKNTGRSCQDNDTADSGCGSKRGCGGGGGPEGCGGGSVPGGMGSLVTGLLHLLVILAIAFLLGLIAWTVARHLKRRAEEQEDALDEEAAAPSTPPGEHPSAEYLRRALDLSAAGDYRGGVRQLLLGCMSWIERRGLIRFRKGLTNRDYLRAVFRREKQRGCMEEIINEFEKIYYGRREATADSFSRCLTRFEEGFAEDEAEVEMAD